MTLISATDTLAMLTALGEVVTIDSGVTWLSTYGIYTAAGSTDYVDGQPVIVEFPTLAVATAVVEDFITGGGSGTALIVRGQHYLVTEYYHDGEGVTKLALAEIEE